uniref:Secreted protein n=1 Tax=Arundo donax TaxID=35708 RepID=A0A0A9CB18_ARUDO
MATTTGGATNICVALQLAAAASTLATPPRGAVTTTVVSAMNTPRSSMLKPYELNTGTPRSVTTGPPGVRGRDERTCSADARIRLCDCATAFVRPVVPDE